MGHTGVYPATGPLPEGDADVLTPGDINEGRTGRNHERGDTARGDTAKPERLPRKGDELDNLKGQTTD